MTTTNQPRSLTKPDKQWSVNYTQGDVDSIREQIEQNESAKRQRLFLALIVTLAALVGAIAWLSTNYALYSASESSKKKLTEENAALKTRADTTQQQLDAKTAQERKEAELSAQAQSKLDKVLPAVLRGDAGATEVAGFARMVHNLPHSRIELTSKPPDKLFRNWKVNDGSGAEVYTLVGGFVDGKWVVYSNLVARRAAGD